MKEIIQKFFGLFGARLIRAKYHRKYLPKSTIDNIEIVARFYALIDRQITLLQVGACDGVTSDSIYRYIKSGKITAFLVEPSTTNFKKLSDFYKGTQNATLINAAIADQDGARLLYSIKDEGRWKDDGWARQLASFNKDHLTKHNFLEHEIMSEEVTCMTLKSVISEYRIKNLDVLLIDTEGYDGEIVRMALHQNITPNFIAFENAQLVQSYSQKELDLLYDNLKNHGYVWTHDRINTLAIKRDFFDDKTSKN